MELAQLATPVSNPVSSVRYRALAIAIHEARLLGLDTPRTKAEVANAIDGMLRSAKDRPGNPWGAAFVSHCMLGAGFSLERILYPSSPLSWISWARRSGRVILDNPSPGDLFFIDTLGEKRIGFVLGIRGKELTLVEGDLHASGRPEGRYAFAHAMDLSRVSGIISLAPRKRSAAYVC